MYQSLEVRRCQVLSNSEGMARSSEQYDREYERFRQRDQSMLWQESLHKANKKQRPPKARRSVRMSEV